MDTKARFTDESSSTGTFRLPTFVPADDETVVAERKEVDARGRLAALEDAVYTHIQAVRALGRDQVTTGEIARALRISPRDVESTLSALVKRGVKPLR